MTPTAPVSKPSAEAVAALEVARQAVQLAKLAFGVAATALGIAGAIATVCAVH